jgi:hypothetical protein
VVGLQSCCCSATATQESITTKPREVPTAGQSIHCRKGNAVDSAVRSFGERSGLSRSKGSRGPAAAIIALGCRVTNALPLWCPRGGSAFLDSSLACSCCQHSITSDCSSHETTADHTFDDLLALFLPHNAWYLLCGMRYCDYLQYYSRPHAGLLLLLLSLPSVCSGQQRGYSETNALVRAHYALGCCTRRP